MTRAVFLAAIAASTLAAGAAQAQQICCVPEGPRRPDGMRGYYDEPRYGERPDESPLRGYVGVEYGKARIGPGAPSTRVEAWTGEGAVSGHLGRLGVQGDIKVANFDTVGGGDSRTVSPTLHAYQRSPYSLVGGWAGWSHTDGADLFGLGLEGQAYFGSATFYGSAGYGRVDDVVNQNLWTGRIEGRYFVTENFLLNAHVGLVRASVAGAHSTVRSVGVGAEYSPGTLPFSVQAGYTHTDTSNSSAESDTLRVGLRWSLDGGTLAERDRLGPSLDNVTDLFLRN
jgi:hypothetical protein